MIYTVTLNPALDKTAEIAGFAAGRVNRITTLRTDPGGKGINVSKTVQSLGGTSTACGILAGDIGRRIWAAVEARGIRTLLVFGEGETRTNLKITDPLRHTCTDINEPGITVSLALLNVLLDKILEKVRPGDTVVLSGSLPPGAPDDTYAVWIRAFKEKGACVFLDADGIAFKKGLQAAPDLVKPNQNELEEYSGHALRSIAACRNAAEEIIRQHGVRRVVVSLGSEGLLFVDPKRCRHAKGLQVPVLSTVGAGDAVLAALALAQDRNTPAADDMRLAAAAGAAAVMRRGSGPPAAENVRELMPLVQIVSV